MSPSSAQTRRSCSIKRNCSLFNRLENANQNQHEYYTIIPQNRLEINSKITLARRRSDTGFGMQSGIRFRYTVFQTTLHSCAFAHLANRHSFSSADGQMFRAPFSHLWTSEVRDGFVTHFAVSRVIFWYKPFSRICGRFALHYGNTRNEFFPRKKIGEVKMPHFSERKSTRQKILVMRPNLLMARILVGLEISSKYSNVPVSTSNTVTFAKTPNYADVVNHKCTNMCQYGLTKTLEASAKVSRGKLRSDFSIFVNQAATIV